MTKELTGEFSLERFASLGELFDYACTTFRERPAYSCFGTTISYGELDELSQRFATYIEQHTELQPGDHIALQLPNLLQFPVAFLGSIKAGLVVVNTNPLYTPREMRHQFRDSEVKAIVILENFARNLQSILPETNIKTVITTETGDLLPWPKRPLMNLAVKHLKKMVPDFSLPESVSFREVLAQGPHYAQDKYLSSGTDTALLLYTGGTTGLAKGAMLTHRNLLANMMQLRSVSSELIRDAGDTILAPLPLYHSYAFTFHCLTMTCAGNHNVLIPNPRDLSSVVRAMRQTKINGFIGINTLYRALIRHPKISEVDFSDMRFSGAGGMALGRRVAEEWAGITDSPVYEGYGLTECSPVVTTNPPHRIRPGSVGTPLPVTELKLVADSGEELVHGQTWVPDHDKDSASQEPAGSQSRETEDSGLEEGSLEGGSLKGELWIRGPQVMKGYWHNEEATREAITEGGWLKSGDYAQFDRDGYVYIVDRKKDMILVSGFNVFPSEIEEVVDSHPKVVESAVVGVEDEDSGEVVKLFVVPVQNPGEPALTEEELRAYCRLHLTPYKVPKQIVFAEYLPKSSIGKILRRELRDGASAGKT